MKNKLSKTTNNNVSTQWYTIKKLVSLLKYYIAADNVNITEPLNTIDQLQQYLQSLNFSSNVTQDIKPQHIVPLNVHAITGALGNDTNHWVGLHITINLKSRILEINYVNPMGFRINDKVKYVIEEALNDYTVLIGEPLLDNGLQYVKKISEIELFGNTDDCGPMLVYEMICLSRALEPIRISNKAESLSLGSFLRDSFKKKLDFNRIYHISKGEVKDNSRNDNSNIALEEIVVEENIISKKEEIQRSLNNEHLLEEIKTFLYSKSTAGLHNKSFSKFNFQNYFQEIMTLVDTIDKDQLLNIIDDNGQTLLHLASFCEKIDMVKLLLEKQPKLLEIKDGVNKTALDYADNNKEITNLLKVGIIQNRIEVGIQQIIPHSENQDTILVIGKTGSGKSSLINYLVNQENLQVVRIKNEVNLFDTVGNLVVSVKDTTDNNMPKIGHTKNSETRIPTMVLGTNGETYCDCPGFDDTKGSLQDIPNAIFLKRIFDISNKVKLVLVIDYSDLKSDRATSIKSLVDTLTRLLTKNDQIDIVTGLSLVVTKTDPRVNVQTIKAEIFNVLTTECFDRDNSKGKEILISLLLPNTNEHIFNKTLSMCFHQNFYEMQEKYKFLRDMQEKIAIFPRATEIGDVLKVIGDNKSILEVINASKYINSPEVSVSVSEESGNFIAGLSMLTVNSLQKEIKNLAVDIKQLYSLEFNQLKSIKAFQKLKDLQDNLTHLLNTIIKSDFTNIEQNLSNLEKKLAEPPLNLVPEGYKLNDTLISDFQCLNFFKLVKDDLELSSIESFFTNFCEVRNEISKFSYSPDSKTLKIQGINITEKEISNGIDEFSDKNQIMDDSVEINSIEIYAQKLILSNDLKYLKLKGIDLSIIAECWEVTKNVVIDISGKEGEPYSTPAKNGDPVTGVDKYGCGKRGNNGEDGLQGSTGGHGGNFFAAGETFIGKDKLTIDIRGGRGGKGQDGGNGSNGSDATADGNKKSLQERALKFLKEMRHIGEKELKFLEIYESRIKQLPHLNDGEVGFGGVGGNAGKMGPGGYGGLPGEAIIIGIKEEQFKILFDFGQNGENGSVGIAGEGGYSGKIYTGMYVNEKFTGHYTKNFIKNAKDWNYDFIKEAVLSCPYGVYTGIKHGQNAIHLFKDGNLLSGSGHLLASTIMTPLAVVLTPLGVPCYAILSPCIALIADIIDLPIVLGLEIYDVYTNSGWQDKFNEKKEQAEKGDVPDKPSRKQVFKQETTYDKFETWLNDGHIIANYQYYLETIQGGTNNLIKTIDVPFDDYRYPKQIESKTRNENLDLNSTSSDSGIEEIEILDEKSIRIPFNPKLNALNQKDNSNYFYQVKDIKRIQSYIEKKYHNKILILDPCDQNESADNIMELLVSARYNVPSLCLFSHQKIGSPTIWVVIAMVQQGNKLIMLFDNGIIEEAMKNTISSGLINKSILDNHLGIYFYSSCSAIQNVADSAVVALDNMDIMAEQLVNNFNNFVSTFENQTCLFRPEKIKHLRECFAKKYLYSSYEAMIAQKFYHRLSIKLENNHKKEIDFIIDKLRTILDDEINIKALGSKEVLDKDNKKLKTPYGDQNISKTVFIQIIIDDIGLNHIYNYHYKIIWTIDLNWGGNVKFKQINEHFKRDDFKFIELAKQDEIEIVPNNNHSIYPNIPMPELSNWELCKALNIEDDISARQVDIWISEYLNDLAEKQVSIYHSSSNDGLLAMLIKSDLEIRNTNIILSKKANEPVVECKNRSINPNSEYEERIIEHITKMMNDLGIKVVVSGNAELFSILNQACFESTGFDLPLDWKNSFLEIYSLSGEKSLFEMSDNLL